MCLLVVEAESLLLTFIKHGVQCAVDITVKAKWGIEIQYIIRAICYVD